MVERVGYQQLDSLLPEGRPLRMVDRLELDLDEKRARGVKLNSVNEEFYQGHFPSRPVMPGVLQVAAMTQVAGALLRRLEDLPPDHLFVLEAINRIKFRKPAGPGDRMQVEAWIDDDRDTDASVFTVKGRTLVDGKVTCEGLLDLRAGAPTDLVPAPRSMDEDIRLPEGVAEFDPADIEAVRSLTPHRYPFLFVDRILHLDRENHRIVALKNVTGNEPFWNGLPVAVVPAYLQAEMAAQAGSVLAFASMAGAENLVLFMSIDSARFREPVVPGDALVLDVEATQRRQFGAAKGSLYVGDRPVTEIALKFAIVPRESE